MGSGSADIREKVAQVAEGGSFRARAQVLYSVRRDLNRPIDMAHTSNRSTFFYELVGMIFIIILGSVLHFTFEWSGNQPLVGLFSAINESVWEHLKLAFWPALLFALIEYPILKEVVNNFAFAKTIGVYLMVIMIPVIFYSYTAVTGKSIFVIDISSFIVAVIVGQLSSYKLLKYRKLAGNFNKVSLIALVLLGLTFVLFTFYPPQLPIFKDPITGKSGLPE
jgi:hypothetical protein